MYEVERMLVSFRIFSYKYSHYKQILDKCEKQSLPFIFHLIHHAFIYVHFKIYRAFMK